MDFLRGARANKKNKLARKKLTLQTKYCQNYTTEKTKEAEAELGGDFDKRSQARIQIYLLAENIINLKKQLIQLTDLETKSPTEYEYYVKAIKSMQNERKRLEEAENWERTDSTANVDAATAGLIADDADDDDDEIDGRKPRARTTRGRPDFFDDSDDDDNDDEPKEFNGRKLKTLNTLRRSPPRAASATSKKTPMAARKKKPAKHKVRDNRGLKHTVETIQRNKVNTKSRTPEQMFDKLSCGKAKQVDKAFRELEYMRSPEDEKVAKSQKWGIRASAIVTIDQVLANRGGGQLPQIVVRMENPEHFRRIKGALKHASLAFDELQPGESKRVTSAIRNANKRAITVLPVYNEKDHIDALYPKK